MEYSEQHLSFLKEPWQELYDESASKSIFSTWDWTALWWKHFRNSLPEGEGTLAVIGVWKGDSLIGIAPFTYPRKQSYGPKRLRPLGDLGAKEALTEETPILFRRGYEDEAADAILHYLRRPRASVKWDYAFLRKSERLSVDDYDQEMDSEDAHLFAVPMIADLTPTWAEYYADRSRSMKTNLGYYPRKVRKQNFKWSFCQARTEDETRRAVLHLVRLHRERVKSSRGITHTSHIPGDLQADFLMDVMPHFAASGNAWIGTIEAEGNVVAAQAFLESKGSLTFYYSGYDIEFYDYSPLFILAAETIKDGISRGIRQLNFLPDKPEIDGTLLAASEWKARWGAVPKGTVSQSVIYTPNARATFIKRLRTLAASLSQSAKAPASEQPTPEL